MAITEQTGHLRWNVSNSAGKFTPVHLSQGTSISKRPDQGSCGRLERVAWGCSLRACVPSYSLFLHGIVTSADGRCYSILIILIIVCWWLLSKFHISPEPPRETKLVRKIGDSGKSEVKLQCLTEEGRLSTVHFDKKVHTHIISSESGVKFSVLSVHDEFQLVIFKFISSFV